MLFLQIKSLFADRHYNTTASKLQFFHALFGARKCVWCKVEDCFRFSFSVCGDRSCFFKYEYSLKLLMSTNTSWYSLCQKYKFLCSSCHCVSRRVQISVVQYNTWDIHKKLHIYTECREIWEMCTRFYQTLFHLRFLEAFIHVVPFTMHRCFERVILKLRSYSGTCFT